ncbi:MAG: acylphosphatase [Huintestinicola sp.]
MIRKHMVFSGSVQGVGFRYRSCYLARSLGVTGWVRNLSDGRVEMEAQGDERAVEELVKGLDGQSFICIDSIESRNIPVVDEYYFEIIG